MIRRKLATATFEYQGQRGDSMVIVGEPGDDPLLGATTLDGFGLVLDRSAASCDRCSFR